MSASGHNTIRQPWAARSPCCSTAKRCWQASPRANIRRKLRPIGVITRVGSGSLAGDDLAVTARRDFAGQGGVTMPGKGCSIAHDYTASERAALGNTAAPLGPQTYDIYLNDVAYWSDIPKRV